MASPFINKSPVESFEIYADDENHRISRWLEEEEAMLEEPPTSATSKRAPLSVKSGNLYQSNESSGSNVGHGGFSKSNIVAFS